MANVSVAVEIETRIERDLSIAFQGVADDQSVNVGTLLIAGLFEIGWAVGLKYTEGFSRLVPSVLTVGAMIISLALLGLALKTLPVGTGYAVWTGVGAVGTAILGIVLLGESMEPMRLASIGLIVAGIVGLKLASPG